MSKAVNNDPYRITENRNANWLSHEAEDTSFILEILDSRGIIAFLGHELEDRDDGSGFYPSDIEEDRIYFRDEQAQQVDQILQYATSYSALDNQ